ncbi:MAG: penicillin-binding protein 2 [Acidimicrobiales bacterium]
MIGAFGWRLVDLQLTPDDRLASDVGSQVRSERILAPRGEILDRHGREIALSLPRPSIVANPQLLQADDEKAVDVDLLGTVVDALAPILSTEPEVIRERLSRDKAFVNLERQVSPEVGEQVKALALPGIYIEEEQSRVHPIGDCSALAVVGRVDLDQKGVSGLEKAYDDRLTGRDGEAVVQTRVGGRVQIPGGSQVVRQMEPGANLSLTLDRNIQYVSERVLVDAVANTQADRGIAIVSDPATGEILAMANVVRDPETGTVECTTTNLGATWSYEPGSTMKAITFSSVFENGAWPEQYPLDIPQNLSIDLGAEGIHTFSDPNIAAASEAHPPTWVLRKSSNNGTILMAREVGPDKLYDTMRSFGLGEVTAVALPGEASGILDRLDSNALELSNAAIGQGVAVSPLQMLVAYNTLANAGLRVDPVVLTDAVGAAEPQRVVSTETAATMMEMLRHVVVDGTGHAAAVPGYVVAGKTGTAWQRCEGEAGYQCADGSRHLTASFAGIISNDQGPALSAIVVIDNPHGGRTGGGDIAAPVFSELASYALRQLRTPPVSSATAPGVRVRASAARPVVDNETEAVADGAT